MIARALALLPVVTFAVVASATHSWAQGPANQSLQVSFQLESSLADAVDLCQVDPFEEKQAREVARRIGGTLGLKNPAIVYEPDLDAECVSLHGFTLSRPGKRPYERVFRFDSTRLFAEAASMGYGPFYVELCHPYLPSAVVVETGPEPDGQGGLCTWTGKSWDEPTALVAEMSFRATWKTLLVGGAGSFGALLGSTLLSILAAARLGRHKRWLWFRRRKWAGPTLIGLLQLGLVVAWLFPAYGLGFIHSLHLMARFGKVGEIVLGVSGALWACVVVALAAVRIGRNTAGAFPLPPAPPGAEFSAPWKASIYGAFAGAIGLVPMVLAITGSAPTIVAVALAIAGAIAGPTILADVVVRINPGTLLDPQKASELAAELRALDLNVDAIRVTERPPFEGPMPSPLLTAGTNLIMWNRLQTLPGREVAAALALNPPLTRTWFIPALTAGITVVRHAIDETLDLVSWPLVAVAAAVAIVLLIRENLVVGRHLSALERTGRRPEAIRGSLFLANISIRLAAAATPKREQTGHRMEVYEPGSVLRRRWFRRRSMDPIREWEHALDHARDLAAKLGYPESTIDAMLRDVVPRADALVPDLPPILFFGDPENESDGEEAE